MVSRLLTFLPLLLCPLLMLACMWAMRGVGNRETPKQQAQPGQDELPTAVRIAQLERELKDLRSRLPRTEAAGAPTAPPPPDPPPATSAGGVDRPVMIPMPPGTAGDA